MIKVKKDLKLTSRSKDIDEILEKVSQLGELGFEMREVEIESELTRIERTRNLFI